MITVRDILQMIDKIAPFDTQLNFDNSGLLVGHPDHAVKCILFALDVTDRVLDEAEAAHADLIVTHHPMLFSARKHMREDDTEGRLLCRMIRDQMALISAHTNLDAAQGGINDTLANCCGLENITGEGFLRIGTLPAPVSADKLVETLSFALHTVIRPMGDPEKPIRKVAVSSGAGSDSWAEALAAGADAFLSGEIKHHHGLAMADAGMFAMEAGHFATEEPGIFALADTLQMQLNEVKWNGYVLKSAAGAYRFPAGR